MTCNPVPTAEEMFDALKEGITLPDLSGVVMPTFPEVDDTIFSTDPIIEIESLTEGKAGGSGVFDRLMTSVTAHLDRERTAGRITNNDFAKSYVDFSNGAMGAAIQFLLQKDQVRWAALAAQTQAKLALVSLATAQVGLEEAKYRMRLMAYQAAGAEAQTALLKMQLATARIEFCTAEYSLENILPKQADNLVAQKLQIEAQTENVTRTTEDLLPEQVRTAEAAADAQIYQTTNILPQQLEQLTEQTKVTTEQYETQRAQTLDTRSNGTTPVAGTLGKQKELHTRQIQSYKQDAQLKAAKPFTDAWITMKTIDEGTLPPTNFNNANLDAILAILRADNDLV